MLVRFLVSNHRSVRDEAELTLVASPQRDDPAGLMHCPVVPTGQVVPAALIYGANASGKSNILSAITATSDMVVRSHALGKPSGGVRRQPFKLDEKYSQLPLRCETDFVMHGVLYNYGFTATDEEFTSEWLHSYPNSRRRVLFNRSDQTFVFSRGLKGRNMSIAKLTRRNSLFLSAAAQNGHEELSKVFSFFSKILSVSEVPENSLMMKAQSAEGHRDNRLIDFLKQFDPGIMGYRMPRTEIPTSIMNEMNEVLSSLDLDLENVDAKSLEIHREVELAHRGVDEKEVFFDRTTESAGTRRLFIILQLVFRALDQGTLLLIDELDSSLHPHACEAVLNLFCSSRSNPHGAQLLATVHNTSLMNSPVLRRDQLWFVEKDRQGATRLYSLTDFKTSKRDDFELGYLQGRFGAVPFYAAPRDVEIVHQGLVSENETTE